MDVSVGFLNFRSIRGRGKQRQLEDWLRLVDLDIFAILESNLDFDVGCHEDPPLTNYSLVCKSSRRDGLGGGVIVFAREHIAKHTEQITDGLPPKNNEIQICRIKVFNKPLSFIYRAPHAEGQSEADLKTFIENTYENEIVMGDFNFCKINWSLGKAPPKYEWFLEAIEKSEKYQVVENFTRLDPSTGKESILDLIITGDPEELRDFKILRGWRERGGSDHYTICFDLAIKPPPKKSKWIYVDNFKKANYVLYRQLLTGMVMKANFDGWDVDQINEWLTNKMKIAWSLSVPKKRVLVGEKPMDITSKRTRACEATLRRLRDKRRRLKDHDSLFLNEEIKAQQKLCRKMKRRDIIKEETRVLGAQVEGDTHISKHLKRFNKIIDKKPGPFENPVTLKMTTSDFEAANVLKDQYQSTYTDIEMPDMNYEPPKGTPKMRCIKFKYNLIQRCIAKMKRRSAAGEDGILPAMIIESKKVLLEPFRRLFQLSYDTGLLPQAWSGALVTPLYKSGKKSNPINFRPISVTSNILKAMEKAIIDLINSHMLRWNLWSESQHGFLKNQSTLNNLMMKKVAVEKNTIGRVPTFSLYLDLSKAFDKVSYANLVRGLQDSGMPKKLQFWYRSLLIHRHFRVKVGDSLSNKGHPSSGAPQGLCSSPILFNMAVNKADGFIITDDIKAITTLERFADDVSVQVKYEGHEGHEAVKKVISNIEEYCKNNSLFINGEKTRSLITGRPAFEYDYYIDGKKIERVECHKDLGHMFQANLKSNRGFDKIIAQMNNRARWIKKCLVTRDSRILSHVWNSMVGCFLLYDHVVLGRPNQQQLAKLQAIMKRFFIGHQPCTSCKEQKAKRKKGIYEECGLHFGPSHIWAQIIASELKLMFKMSKGWFKTQFPIEDLTISNHGRTRLSLDRGLLIPEKKHIIARKSFIGRCSTWWNEVPGSLRNCKSALEFSNGLKKLDLLLTNSGKYDQRAFDHKASMGHLDAVRAKYKKLEFFIK